ncbi:MULTISPECIES: YflJ family protein [Bacillaceae]|uniref:YflJ family protein n=1 Tax=Bacillaceae TaxID=186817 RepID=UPI001E52C73B|nr:MULTISPECIES: YflJ family protein [Bacillaceae]MCE4047317.1 YflJ family protein [Bacillus sp. Au-Bac7]MCM3030595.1 YflJ family protein [Niallia sp. MER 6]MDL0437116.1 YflJ family protein [Niallia sp. SS-2023]UPO86323.1 YflJ family protein [Niallia sp. Man26]
MAYYGSKGWYVARLKELGLNRHPQEQRKLELYKVYILRNLYEEQLAKMKGDN